MKTLTLITLLSIATQLHAQRISPEDSLQIVQQVEDWNEAWKIKDPVLAAKWYTDDADFTNAFGFSMIGREAIEEYLTRVFKMDFVMAGNSEQTAIKLKYISDNAILAVSTISRKGQKMSDNSEVGDRRTTHHRLFRKDGEWAITAHLISDARSIKSSKH